MSEEGEFSVYQFFPDGACERVRQFVGAREAVETAKSYSERPAARIGIIKRIIITDGGDYLRVRVEAWRGRHLSDAGKVRCEGWHNDRVGKTNRVFQILGRIAIRWGHEHVRRRQIVGTRLRT